LNPFFWLCGSLIHPFYSAMGRGPGPPDISAQLKPNQKVTLGAFPGGLWLVE
jgi:hypothetical protein